MIEVDYRFPAGIDAAKMAKVIAVGQTAGSWDERFSHAADSLKAHLATVHVVRPQPDGSSVATVHFPEHNVEGDLGTLLTMIFGKFSMAGSGRVVDVRLPSHYGMRPRFGIAGIRRLVGADKGPVVMAIFKPALGLSAEDHARILADVAEGGLHVIKDDEIMANLPSAPTLDRVRAAQPILSAFRKRTGRELLYAVNVTGRADVLLERAREAVAAGANALLLNVLTHGWSVLEALATDPKVNVPIFAHPALAGAFCASPDHGFDYRAILGRLMARSGADAVLYPAHYGSLPFAAEQERAIRDDLRAEGVFPVPSAGIVPGVVPRVLADYGDDVILNAGTGIMDHPDGATAGVAAFFEALAFAQPGVPFALESLPAGPLRRAIEKFGP
jgi:2,3-diketo-5-methylthiopentyl-1-phosphate enolase